MDCSRGPLQVALAAGLLTLAATTQAGGLRDSLLPRPRSLEMRPGALPVSRGAWIIKTPAGREYEACGEALMGAVVWMGARPLTDGDSAEGCRFSLGRAQGVCPDLPPLPEEGGEEAYVLAVSPEGIGAQARGPAGLLHAAQTAVQLLRCARDDGQVPALEIRDWPQFPVRGIYIEGGQERNGRIVEVEYLEEQIRRLAELKMNALVIECYNIFPFASFPACADAASLKPADVERLKATARRFHVTLIPSLQTLAQVYELVWTCPEGEPYREVTAPGLNCPSNPDLYPFLKGLFRDLLTTFEDAPVLGIGCSEIEMQWQGRYCPRCQKRVDAGAGPRDLLLEHAAKVIGLVREVAAELGHPARPMMWGDEFYMYGPGRDWVGIERIEPDTVMGYWKYWPDYDGIEGLLARGYDVLGISAIYNHCFYLADMTPADPPKAWAPLEQTGVVNISGMAQTAAEAAARHPERKVLGIATASFSKHRLRAFDSLWYGFAMNGECCWAAPQGELAAWQPEFTEAFARQWYGARDQGVVARLAAGLAELDQCKSLLEHNNQVLHDVVGVYDTQEPGYTGNTILGAARTCLGMMAVDGTLTPELEAVRQRAARALERAWAQVAALEGLRGQVERPEQLVQLVQAGVKIAAHAEREVLLVESQQALRQAAALAAEARPAALQEQARRWTLHVQRTAEILEEAKPLYHGGDPLGLQQVLAEVRTIERHFRGLATGAALSGDGQGELVAEGFASVDPAQWKPLGEAKVVDGGLETRAPGGWDKRCGALLRKPLELKEDAPAVVEFDLTPREMNVDSQLVTSANEAGEDSYRFAFYGPRDRFGLYTRSERALEGGWVDPAAGWHLRAQSPAITLGTTYRVRLEITRSSFRVVVRLPGEGAYDLPLWDTGAVPMDALERSQLMMVDVEPPGATAASRWENVRVYEAR